MEILCDFLLIIAPFFNDFRIAAPVEGLLRTLSPELVVETTPAEAWFVAAFTPTEEKSRQKTVIKDNMNEMLRFIGHLAK